MLIAVGVIGIAIAGSVAGYLVMSGRKSQVAEVAQPAAQPAA